MAALETTKVWSGFAERGYVIPTRQLLGSVLRALDERPRPAIVLQVMETFLPGGKTDRAWGGLFAKYTGPMPMGTESLLSAVDHAASTHRFLRRRPNRADKQFDIAILFNVCDTNAERKIARLTNGFAQSRSNKLSDVADQIWDVVAQHWAQVIDARCGTTASLDRPPRLSVRVA